MADRLIIHDVEAPCRIGVFDWEREKPQTVWIDLELEIDAASAAANDDVEDAVDYARLVDAVRAIAQQRSYRLLETLAETLTSHILSEYATPVVRIKIKKRALKRIGYAAVELERRVDDERAPRRRVMRGARARLISRR